MSSRRFSARIESDGKRRLLRIPLDPDEAWGEREVHHVSGTVAGFPIRGPLARDAQGFFMALGPSWLKDHPLDSDEVEAELAPEGPQADGIGPDVTAAMDADPEAKAFFTSLPSFYRKNFVRWIEDARKPETRARRIAEMMLCLRDKRRER